MALKDVLALADDKLRETFHLKPHDPVKARKPHLTWLDKRKAAWADIGNKRDRFIKVNNGVVEFHLPFELGGKSVFYVPSERFADFLEKLHIAVNTGEADEAIAALNKGARTPGPARGKRGPLSPEALEARRAKMAAKKK
ncbi:MAG: hypothetical protein E7773_10160 [Sphingomonas sp.]|uniref:hypothetical protein n=1 Tax=Sphingomonas sp. TaxID=28214 RepID=UPI00120E0901|nr:hypothetical protein [Sphingomonas sp.]THD35701.1 MAG: hypothetical protein E7773_10160 [Sphingomonas sp.]